jgi:hypothetical protein
MHAFVSASARNEGKRRRIQPEPDSKLYVRVSDQCCWFRTKQNPRVRRLVIQWFDAQPIADQEKPLLAQVPYRKRENPLKPFRNFVAPLKEATQYNLRIASGAELMTITL